MQEIFLKRFKQYKELGDKTLAQLSDELIFLKPGEDSNSIAILVQHIGGNMVSRWTNFLSEDGEKSWRNRDSEFEDTLKDRKSVEDVWENGWDLVFSEISKLTDEDLQREITIRGEKLSVFDALLRQLSHYAYHVGQIVYIAKMHKNSDWQTLSIPKNKSQEYNEQFFRRNDSPGNILPE